MITQILKLMLLGVVIFQTGCNITLKKKMTVNTSNPVNVINIKSHIKSLSINRSYKKDTRIINAFYANATNAIIRKDMMSHTEVSQEQEKKLVVGEIIPRDIQVMPLPLVLEKRLSALPLHLLRVQVGSHVILLDVKSRQILDIIKI